MNGLACSYSSGPISSTNFWHVSDTSAYFFVSQYRSIRPS